MPSEFFSDGTLYILLNPVFSLHLGVNLGRQTVKVDKAGGISLIVNLVLVKGCDFGVVEGIG